MNGPIVFPADWNGSWESSRGHHSAWLQMLPQYEQTALYNSIAAGRAEGGMTQARSFGPHSLRPYSLYKSRIPGLLCPSDPGAQGNGWSNDQAPVNYATNFGDSTLGTDGGHNGEWGSSKPRGMFGIVWGEPGLRTGGRAKAHASVTDGTSNTLMFSEITIFNGEGRIKGHYTMMPDATFRATPIACMQTKGPNGTIVGPLPPSHHRHGESWASGFTMNSGFTAILPPNAPSCANAQGEWQEGIYSANSYHTGGVNAVNVDGSVRFISETIDTGNLSARVPTSGPSPYGLWGALGTSAGGEVGSVPE